MRSQIVEATAPGKLVLSGEYAVLTGAPALILAVNARVMCRIETTSSGGWQFETRPSSWNANCSLQSILAGDLQDRHPAELVPYLIPRSDNLPVNAKVLLNTERFFIDGKKLGIGSSAALTVAFASALSAITGEEIPQDRIRHAHSRVFGSGSGLDIATSSLGGLVRYQDGVASNVDYDQALKFRFVFTGSSSSTASMVKKFRKWMSKGQDCSIHELLDAATATANSTDNSQRFLENLARFIQQLWQLDRRANIGIWGEQHKTCQKIAESLKILYKPCGAGGGDTGMAVSTDENLLESFSAQVRSIGLIPLNFEGDPNGIRIQHF